MSYVLDALRRAEAERARGGLPGLHAQPAAASTALPTPAPGTWPARRVAVGALLVLLAMLAALAVVWLAGGWRPAGGGAAPVARHTVDAGDAGRTTDTAAAPPPSAPAQVHAQAAIPAPAPAALPPAGMLPATASVPPRPVVREPPTPAPAAPADVRSAASEGPSAARAAAPPARVPALAELPATLRQQLPPLAFGGATDSTQPSARMLLINGQVFREGDEVAPGLRLERIRLRSAQMRWRDQPFEVAY